MLVLLHLAKHLAPTQRPLGSTYVVSKGVWSFYGELQVTMI
jgi:hypothetical protein